MEVMMIFPLLLLMCSLSTAELQTAQLSNNEIIPQGEQTESQGRRAANAFDPQHTGPGDIHAVLSEMSTLLAEQKVEIRHLQRENEAQAAQLRDLELQKSGLEKLKQQVQVKVAFSASLLASGSGTIGPFNTHTPLAFRYVLTNIGNAYNPNSAELQTAQLSNNEIIPQGEQTESQGRRAANASDRQLICPEDIHAVLREMSALLAEQKVEIRHLQRENEAQAAQLRDLELQKPGLEKLKQQVQAQSEELTLLKASANVTENQVEALVEERKVKVAFSASLLASGSGTIGPFNTDTPLAFRYVLTNIGNAYNPDSGFFIAPVRGVYRFEFTIGAHGDPSHATGAMLVKNGQNIFIAYEHQTGQYGTSAKAAILLLE
ncbi:hypothetical protein INR49_022372, partial [Caranx melampygus]